MKILIEAHELKNNLDGYTIVDLRSTAEYIAGHVAGAVSLPAGDPPLKTDVGFPSAADWAALLSVRGITRGTRIVAYDDGKSGRAVARFWYIAKHYGHGDVFILNGGFGPALADHVPISCDVPEIIPAIYATNATQGYFLALDEILKNHDKIKFLDIRTPEEFMGDDLRGNPRGGHLRGAVLAEADNFFADAPGQSFATPAKLLQTMDRLGIRKSDFIVTY